MSPWHWGRAEMDAILQEVLVGIIVAICAVFSAWRLMSLRMRMRTLDVMGPVLGKLGAASFVARLRAQTIGQLASGCGACSHNKTAVHLGGEAPHSSRSHRLPGAQTPRAR
jgi:hypothetical protein